MQYRRALLVLPLLTALGACSSGTTPKVTATGPSADVCAGVNSGTATAVPESCAPTLGPTSDPSATATASAQLSPVKLAPDQGQVAAGGNDVDPSLTTMTFHVTIPTGTRLKVHAACLGNHNIVIKTQPTSDAESEFNCGIHGVASEVGVSDPHVVSAPTSFTVTVTTTAPTRWWVNVVGTTEPTGKPI